MKADVNMTMMMLDADAAAEDGDHQMSDATAADVC